MSPPPELQPRGIGTTGTATQLSILLDAARGLIDEEFKRSERLEGKSRNQIGITGTLFAIVQAIVVGLLNGVLAGDETHEASAFVPWLGLTGGAAMIAMLIAVLVSYRSWRLRDDPALGTKTITDYIEAARQDNPAVGVKLIGAYATIVEGRRANNAQRARALDRAAMACGGTVLLVATELVLAFLAVATF